MAEYKSEYTGEEIDDGIAKANTAVQPEDLANVATSGSYNDLSNKPSEVTETTVANWGFTKNTGTYSKPSGGIPKTDLAKAVQTSLGKADTAIQDISSKQDTLVSGTNIKTINNTSLLGSGNITIEGGGSTPYSMEMGSETPTDSDATYWIDIKPPFSDLKVGCLGDSITYGVGATTTYVKLLEQDFGEVINYGVSSSCITNGVNTVQSFVQRYSYMANDLDVVIVFGGTNDLGWNATFGTDDDSTTATEFKGALNLLITGLMDKYPEKTIIFCTPTSRNYGGYNNTTPNNNGVTLKMIRDQIISRCNYYSLPCLDLYGMSGMNISYSSTARNTFTSDGLHLNNKGHEKIYKLIINYIKQLRNISDEIKIKGKQNNSWVNINANYVPEDNLILKGDYADQRELTSISAVYTQGQTIVYPDTSLNDLKTNLVVTATYDDSSTKNVPNNAYTLSGTLSTGTSIVTVNYLGKTTTFSVTVTERPVLSYITAVYTQGQTVIYPDTSLDTLKTDLIVTAHYSDESTAVVSDYTLSGTLSSGTSTITVTYENKTTTFNVNVTNVTLSSIEATYTQSEIVYENASLNDLKSDLVVVATYSDNSTRTLLSSEYTLSGTLTAGTSTITVTFENKTDTFNVTVTAITTLSSITATYTQGQAIVYPDTPLNDLKSNLVIVANYSDSSTETLSSSDYTLSGTLTVGTSIITATYEGLTDTFSVTVTAHLYTYLQYLRGDGNSWIDTGIKANQDTNIEIKALTERGTDTFQVDLVAGTMNSYSADVIQYGFSANNNIMYARYYNGFASLGNIQTNTEFVLKIEGGKGVLNGNSPVQLPSGDFETQADIRLFSYKFASGSPSGLRNLLGRIYYCKIWEDGTLVRNFVPVKRNTDNEYGMLDTVNNVFYTNLGTGTFTAENVE